MLEQRFGYDWLGNTSSSGDDANGFYDRSLGTITNDFATGKPYQLVAASNETQPAVGADRRGHLTAAYDDAGHLVSLSVARRGPCLPASARCTQRFAYEWDETGQLARARRWDLSTPDAASDPVPTAAPSAELRYAYDGAGARVRKTALDGSGDERHTLYVFGSFELRRARYEAQGPSVFDYVDDVETEAVRLGAGGHGLGRLWFEPADLPAPDGARLHVFLTLPDVLGSSSILLDKATGELVEASTYQAYGAAESDYRPERWRHQRDDYRFTGKEDDVELGLVYFGARYYAPALGRWASADPLAVHELGGDLNAYAYVHGRVLRAVDPLGLSEIAAPAAAASPPPVTELGNGASAATPPAAAAAPPASAPAAPSGAPVSSSQFTPAPTWLSERAGPVTPSLADSFTHGLTQPGKDLGNIVLEKAQAGLNIAGQLSQGDYLGALDTYTDAVSDNFSMLGSMAWNGLLPVQIYHAGQSAWELGNDIANGRWNGVAEAAGRKMFEGLLIAATEGASAAVGKLGAMMGPLGRRALPPGRAGSVVRGGLDKAEAAFAEEIVKHRGGNFVGVPKRNAPGIDGHLNGAPVSLKETQGGLSAILRHASKAEKSAANAGYRGVEVFIRAPNVGKAELLDFAQSGPLSLIPNQGTISSINVFTRDGVVRLLGGP